MCVDDRGAPPAAGGRRARKETAAKVPPQASENAREQHGKGVELCFRAFLQQSAQALAAANPILIQTITP